MYYFIPFLESMNQSWQVDIVPWYQTTHRLEFDDVLHQIRIFKREGIKSKIVLLPYHPHMRYLLHRQDLLEVEAFSVFDAIQDIENEEIYPLQLKDLAWDEDCDFIYTPFLIAVKQKGELHAHIEFGTEGFISYITYFKDNQVDFICYFDDRGFLSSLVKYQDNQAVSRYYYNSNAEWQIKEYLQGIHTKVEVNPRFSHRFRKSTYQSVDEVVWEFFEKFLTAEYKEGESFVLAAQTKYQNQLLKHLPEHADKILTFFIERNQEDDLNLHHQAVKQAKILISDRQDFLERLKQHYPQFTYKMHHLPSFDTRLKLGVSQRVKESKLYVQLDLNTPLNSEALYEVLNFVSQNPLTEIVFATFNAEGYQIEALQKHLFTLISERLNFRDLLKESIISGAENKLEENKEENYRFQIVNLNDEIGLIRELEYTRLIVDLNPIANIYTQIAGISAGIPQINLSESEYVTHLQNGYILSDLSEFSKAGHYFLDTLEHWNQALIHSIDKIRQNTGNQFVQKWERWLEEAKSEQ
ncbi:Accessory secretion protein [Streptococcus pneumoniae]|uniref:accessory Sec system protein Asp1 n=2 Tax=Streptococcus pneumoniae TaxID=1313 RepID=UPI0003C0F08A|nr:accessory Sec system protein Asp1 [Streptococcus pneumoniae]ESP65460.1 Accessory secretion protein [Streptococcus pneumoniae BHN191]ESP63797.1 Accessory secretion protein [Streptococcus pneumoniae BHN418]KXW27568.1 accessory secretory protein [Streptococcus pneumoniae]MBW5035540.1 accessory Sec system protein Asp1 [Streptococcus pneumoniae]MBW5062584.1 accessory Sec system protein Asp1 [Streptococcus pneumoniae]